MNPNLTDPNTAYSVKNYNVESRTQMDPYQWAKLSAEFNAALREPEMLKYFIRRIERWKKESEF